MLFCSGAAFCARYWFVGANLVFAQVVKKMHCF
jgi:hypothetical protein